MAKTNPAGLPGKQPRFVEEYLLDLNGTQAAIRAGYSEKTAYSAANRLLKDPKVAAAIAEAMAARTERKKIDADWVLERLEGLANASIADFLVTPEKGMPYYDLSGATPEQLAAIEGLQLDTVREKGEDGVVIDKIKITLPSKLKTLELIGRHVDVQAFADRKEIGGIGGGPLEVKDVSMTEAARRIAFVLANAAKE